MSKKYSAFLPTNQSTFQLEQFPFYWISKVHAQYIAYLDAALKRYGVDHSRRQILMMLSSYAHQESGLSISEISDFLISKISTTTKTVYRLKEEGLVETFACSHDKRITRVKLTEKGAEIVVKINDLTSAILEHTFDGLTPLQIERMSETLKMISNNMVH